MLQALSSDFLFSIIAFGLILIPAIIIHELGHFFAAKWAGINVLEFGVGFPPRLATLFRWGETDFTLNWLPLGGFVRPLGEDMLGPNADPDEDGFSENPDGKPKKSAFMSDRDELIARGVPEEDLKSVSEAKPLPRIFFMAAGALANVVSAIVLFIIAALFGLPEFAGVRVQIVDIPANSEFSNTPVQVDDAIERVNGERFETYDALFSYWLSQNDDPVTLSMLRPADETQYEVTLPASALESISGLVRVTTIVEDTPAAEAGIQAGDLISAINGEPLNNTDPTTFLVERIQASVNEPVRLSVLRDGQIREITVTPRDAQNGGQVGIGIQPAFRSANGVQFNEATPQQQLAPKPLGEAVVFGFSQTYDILELIVTLPAQLINGVISPEQARPVSVVGISQIGGSILQQSVAERNPSVALHFMGMISIFLGITNLLPIPALDGGRIVFVIIEMVRGKPVPPHIENQIHYIGMALLLLLGVIVIFYDIFNPLDLFVQ